MEPTTSDTFQEIDGHHHHETNLPIIIVSSMIPTCVVIVLFIVVRKVLIQPIYELKQRSDKPVPDIDRVTNQKIILKSSSKSKKLKQDKSNNGKGQNFFSVPVFPREPVYKIQQTPSYIVPFTELPTNFDFSLANVEVYSDFVIIKDSSILQTYWRGSLENPYLVT